MIPLKLGRESNVVVGKFGNEFCLREAFERLKGVEGLSVKVDDRWTLTVRLIKRGDKTVERVRDIIRSSHGYVEPSQKRVRRGELEKAGHLDYPVFG